jgi:hypothetical protein
MAASETHARTATWSVIGGRLSIRRSGVQAPVARIPQGWIIFATAAQGGGDFQQFFAD